MNKARLSGETIFTGKVFSVEADQVQLPHGPTATLHVIRHPVSVVLIPLPDPDHVILVRQYRYAIDRWLWELPAGSVDPGESPEEAARRECHEEIGQRPGLLEQAAQLYPTPGYCDELMFFYRATELYEPAELASPDEDEDLEIHTFTLAEARALVTAGDAPDMKTAAGLTMV